MSVSRKAASQLCSQPCSFSCSNVLDDQIADDARHARHALGQFLGGGDGQGGLLEEGGEQLRELLFAVGQRLELAFGVQLGDAHSQPFLAADEPAELQVVGEKPVGQGVAVTGELLAVRALPALHLVEIRADVLGLDVAERYALADDLEVGAAAKDSLWLVRGRDALPGRLQQGLQGGAVRMLGRITGTVFLPNHTQIFSKGSHAVESNAAIGLRQPHPPVPPLVMTQFAQEISWIACSFLTGASNCTTTSQRHENAKGWRHSPVSGQRARKGSTPSEPRSSRWWQRPPGISGTRNSKESLPGSRGPQGATTRPTSRRSGQERRTQDRTGSWLVLLSAGDLTKHSIVRNRAHIETLRLPTGNDSGKLPVRLALPGDGGGGRRIRCPVPIGTLWRRRKTSKSSSSWPGSARASAPCSSTAC